MTDEEIKQYIDNKIGSHTHNGSDSVNILGSFLSQAPQPSVTAPTGGATVDTQARAAITTMLSQLKALGIFN